MGLRGGLPDIPVDEQSGGPPDSTSGAQSTSGCTEESGWDGKGKSSEERKGLPPPRDLRLVGWEPGKGGSRSG